MSELEKKPEDFALEYAGFWIRFAAIVIDILIIFLFLYIIDIMISGLVTRLIVPSLSIKTTCFISWLIGIAYLASFWTWRGQTPGKIILGIKIIRTDSSPITWQHALLRYLGYIVSTLIICIGFIMIAFDNHKQGLHDKIADTYVVKLPVRQVIYTKSYVGGEVG